MPIRTLRGGRLGAWSPQTFAPGLLPQVQRDLGLRGEKGVCGRASHPVLSRLGLQPDRRPQVRLGVSRGSCIPGHNWKAVTAPSPRALGLLRPRGEWLRKAWFRAPRGPVQPSACTHPAEAPEGPRGRPWPAGLRWAPGRLPQPAELLGQRLWDGPRGPGMSAPHAGWDERPHGHAGSRGLSVGEKRRGRRGLALPLVEAGRSPVGPPEPLVAEVGVLCWADGRV